MARGLFNPAAVTVPSLKRCLGCCKRCYGMRKQEATASIQLVGMTGYPTRTYNQWWTRLVLLFMGTKSEIPLLWHRLYLAAGHSPHVLKIKTLPSVDNSCACPSSLMGSTTSIPVKEHDSCQGSSDKGKEEEKLRYLQTVILFPFLSPTDFFNPFLYHSQHGNASISPSPSCPLSIIDTQIAAEKGIKGDAKQMY